MVHLSRVPFVPFIKQLLSSAISLARTRRRRKSEHIVSERDSELDIPVSKRRAACFHSKHEIGVFFNPKPDRLLRVHKLYHEALVDLDISR
jgi:hypothetical protein